MRRAELQYLVELSAEPGVATGDEWAAVGQPCASVVRQLQKLTERIDAFVNE
jgi:hypothetical protein